MKINLLFLSIFLLIITSVDSRLYSYNETIKQNLPPRLWDQINYSPDSTLILRIAYRGAPSSIPNTALLQEKLSLRILFQNGTVRPLDLDLQIPSMNYMIMSSTIQTIDPIKIHAIKYGYILVTYVNTTNATDITTYEDWGMVINWDGNIISKQKFGDSYINNNTWRPSFGVVPNINDDKGWLFFSAIRNTFNIHFKQYKLDENTSEIIKLPAEGDIPMPGSEVASSIQINCLPTVDENYAFILANTSRSINTTVDIDPLANRGQMSIINLAFNASSVTGPKLLYQTALDNLTFVALKCGVDYVNIGHTCILTFRRDISSTTPTANIIMYYVKVSFLSTGSVIDISPVNNILPTSNVNVTQWVVAPLSYGGYLLTSTLPITSPTDLGIYGYLYDEYSKTSLPWEFSEPTSTNIRGLFGVLDNNTAIVAQQENTDSWSLLVADLPRFTSTLDKGYSNLHVQNTFPPINAVIAPSSTAGSINITYYNAVDLSEGAISVYLVQGNGQPPILRQMVFGSNTQYCTISSDGLTINVIMLQSTFAQQGGSYYIKVDNNFVESREFQEPIIGVPANVWKFTTEPEVEKIAGSTTGLLRLTGDGTTYFESLDSAGQEQFYNTLTEELADLVPIPRSRLTSTNRKQVDTSTVLTRQLLLSINIEQTKDQNSKSVANIIRDLDTMIMNKDVTAIKTGKSTQYLDATYGLQASPNIWEKYKLKLLALFLGVAILITLFLLAQRRDSKGRNMAILQLGLIIFDLIIDVLFVVSNGKDVESLYIPSVVFLTIPIALNTVLAFVIITKENENPESKFYKWFMQHGKVASIFTVLAGADIDALTILHSKLAGFEAFNAPFSNDALSKIFWGACSNIFLEDIPQVIVQILYQQKTVTYDIIPLLTLISSCLNLTINIIGRTYQATNSLRHKGRNTATSSFDEDFGNISDDQEGTLNNKISISDENENEIKGNYENNNIKQETGFNLKSRFKEMNIFNKK